MRHIWDNLAVFQFGFTANTLALAAYSFMLHWVCVG
jgi:hypothetical protein